MQASACTLYFTLDDISYDLLFPAEEAKHCGQILSLLRWSIKPYIPGTLHQRVQSIHPSLTAAYLFEEPEETVAKVGGELARNYRLSGYCMQLDPGPDTTPKAE